MTAQNDKHTTGTNKTSAHLTKAKRLLSSASHGAKSVAKTQVLRKDRASEAVYSQRLEVCKSCPGGHATFKDNGSLHTCGPMIKSMVDSGQKTCGCVLSRKARDIKEDCPFGYWPAPDTQPKPIIVSDVREAVETAAAVIGDFEQQQQRLKQQPSSAQRCPNCGGYLSRREFLGHSLVAATAMGLAAPRIFAQSSENTQYVKVKPCVVGEGTHIKCSYANGRMEGEVFYAKEDGNTYRLENYIEKDEENVRKLITPNGDWVCCCDECGLGYPHKVPWKFHRGDWESGIDYVQYDMVKGSNGRFYVCDVAHTSDIQTEPGIPPDSNWDNIWTLGESQMQCVWYTAQGIEWGECLPYLGLEADQKLEETYGLRIMSVDGVSMPSLGLAINGATLHVGGFVNSSLYISRWPIEDNCFRLYNSRCECDYIYSYETPGCTTTTTDGSIVQSPRHVIDRYNINRAYTTIRVRDDVVEVVMWAYGGGRSSVPCGGYDPETHDPCSDNCDWTTYNTLPGYWYRWLHQGYYQTYLLFSGSATIPSNWIGDDGLPTSSVTVPNGLGTGNIGYNFTFSFANATSSMVVGAGGGTVTINSSQHAANWESNPGIGISSGSVLGQPDPPSEELPPCEDCGSGGGGHSTEGLPWPFPLPADTYCTVTPCDNAPGYCNGGTISRNLLCASIGIVPCDPTGEVVVDELGCCYEIGTCSDSGGGSMSVAGMRATTGCNDAICGQCCTCGDCEFNNLSKLTVDHTITTVTTGDGGTTTEEYHTTTTDTLEYDSCDASSVEYSGELKTVFTKNGSHQAPDTVAEGIVTYNCATNKWSIGLQVTDPTLVTHSCESASYSYSSTTPNNDNGTTTLTESFTLTLTNNGECNL